MISTPDFYYIDASVPIAIAESLSLVRRDIMYPAKPGCPVKESSVRDTEWLPIVGSAGWPVIMRDKRIRQRPAEKRAFKNAGVRAFVMTAGGNLSRWETLSLLVRKWSDIERLAASAPAPSMFAITSGVTREIDLA